MDSLITLAQARRSLTDSQIRHRLDGGAWRRLFRGVYLPAAVPVDRALTVRAALLSAGPGLVAVRESAAVLHGFDLLPEPRVHLAGRPDTARTAQPGLVIHAATFAPEDVTYVDGVPCTTGVRTAADLARLAPRIDAIAVVDAALRAGACTREQLLARVAELGRSRGIVQARQLAELADPRAESPMESRLRLRFVDGGLPRPQPQLWVCDERYRLDMVWEECLVGAEYDGIGHLDRLAQRRDLARRNRLAAAGWIVYSFTDTDVYRHHGRMVEIVRAGLARAHYQARPC